MLTSRTRHLARALSSTMALLFLGAAPASAQTEVWPFELDPSIAEDPAGVQSRLDELGEGVPPIPAGDLVATTVEPLTLYFHEAMLELLELAYDSGPGFQDYFERDAEVCAQHSTFTPPDLLPGGGSSSCQQAEQSILDAFDDDGASCLRIEFPELYIYDQTPGEADSDDLQTVEGLIRIAGEVFTHIDWPTGILPDGFVDDTRRVIAKVRYATLRANVVARQEAYAQAAQLLDDNSDCFDAGAALSLDSKLDALLAELDAAEASLEAIQTAGLAQAAADRAELHAAGRHRNDLPFPSLTDRERELLALYIGGIYWRMRGEALLTYPESGLLRRLLYTQYPYQVIADITGGVDSTDFGRDIFIHENWGYWEWMDIGRNPGPGNDKYSDMVDMAKRGKRTLTLAAPRLEERGYDNAYLYSGGLQMGPCYYYAWEPLWEPDRFFQVGEDLTDPYVWFLESPTAFGEFCTGGALGIGLARSLLHGKPGAPDDAGVVDPQDPDGGIEPPDAGSSASDAGTAEPDDGGASRADAGDGTADDGDDSTPDDGAPDPGADDDGDDDELVPPGCACDAGGADPLGGVWTLALALMWLLRRRARS
jgi:MYXO-CTERM domain-containing protein